MNSTLQVPFWRSVLGAALVGAVGFGWGIARTIAVPVPAVIAPSLRVVRRFLLGVALLGLVALIASAFVHRSAFAEVLRAVAGDSTSTVQVLLLCVVYVPTVIAWTVAVALGPGFSLGSGTVVSLTGVQLGALPPVPLLALVPEALPQPAWAILVLPAVIAIWATHGVRPTWPAMATTIALGAVTSGLLALTVAGGMGPGRLAMVGVVWWQIALASAGWLGLGFAVHGTSHWARRVLAGPRRSGERDAGKLRS